MPNRGLARKNHALRRFRRRFEPLVFVAFSRAKSRRWPAVWEHGNLLTVKPIEAEYRDGVLKPGKRLDLSHGERVSSIVLRRPDPAT